VIVIPFDGAALDRDLQMRQRSHLYRLRQANDSCAGIPERKEQKIAVRSAWSTRSFHQG